MSANHEKMYAKMDILNQNWGKDGTMNLDLEHSQIWLITLLEEKQSTHTPISLRIKILKSNDNQIP